LCAFFGFYIILHKCPIKIALFLFNKNNKNKENKMKILKTFFLGNQKRAAYRPHGYWPTRP
jgi:hypothetical protein